MIYFWVAASAFVLAVLATVIVRKFAWRWQVLDSPNVDPERRAHKSPTPLLGGLAIIASFDVVSVLAYLLLPIIRDNIPFHNLVAIWLASLVLGLGGFLDDKYNLSPGRQFIFPLLAVLIVVASGMGVSRITNPFGGQINLPGPLLIQATTLIGGLFAVIWLLGMIYTTKFLDGLDGLASSIGLVSSLALFALCFTPKVLQGYTAVLTAILAGALSGFLIFNWHPAKIFLGESGSEFIGFILGIFAIIAGGKIATAFLVMGVPILDVFWVIVRRIMRGASPFKADRGHLHFRLLDLGLPQTTVVLILTAIAAAFGVAAVLLQSLGKFWALVILLVGMISFGGWIVVFSRRQNSKKASLDPSPRHQEF